MGISIIIKLRYMLMEATRTIADETVDADWGKLLVVNCYNMRFSRGCGMMMVGIRL